MKDEEKAEEYYEDNECYSYLSEVEDFEEVFGFVKDRVKQAYLDGLAEGRKENEDLLIREYSNRCEQRRIIHKNLIDSFSEQLGILDKEDDVLFSLKAIKAIISNILEIEK